MTGFRSTLARSFAVVGLAAFMSAAAAQGAGASMTPTAAPETTRSSCAGLRVEYNLLIHTYLNATDAAAKKEAKDGWIAAFKNGKVQGCDWATGMPSSLDSW